MIEIDNETKLSLKDVGKDDLVELIIWRDFQTDIHLQLSLTSLINEIVRISERRSKIKND